MDLDKILKGVGEIAKEPLEIKRLNTSSDYKDPWLKKGKGLIGYLQEEKRQYAVSEQDLNESNSSVAALEGYTSDSSQDDSENGSQRPPIEAEKMEYENSRRPIYYSSISVDDTDIPTRLDAACHGMLVLLPTTCRRFGTKFKMWHQL